MKPLKLTLLLGVLVFTFGLNSCKKGDEDPFISFRSRKARLEGKWLVKTLTYDGEDELRWQYSSDFINDCGYRLYYTETFEASVTIEFSKSGSFTTTNYTESKTIDFDTSYDLCDVYYDYDNSTETAIGNWEFRDKKKKIMLLNNDGTTEEYTIDRLSNDEMYLSGYESGGVIDMTLEKI